MWNMREPILMEAERANMNETQLYPMLHMTMIQIRWHADLQNMYLLCKWLYMAGFAQSTQHKLPLTRRDLCSSLESYEDLQSARKSWNNISNTNTHTHKCRGRFLFVMLNQRRRDFFYIQIDICDGCHIPMDPLLWHPENEGAWHFIRYLYA